MAHEIHFAVCDALYEYTEYDFDGSETSGNEEEILDEDGKATKTPNFNHSYDQIIKKIRKYVKLFRKSPVKNDDYLQTLNEKFFGKEIALGYEN